MGGGVSFAAGSGEDEEKKKKKDGRRRNSLAYNISTFIQYEEDDFQPLCDKVRQDLVAQGLKKEKVTKFSKVADAVLRGNNRELKHQVVDYSHINRKYGDQHNQSHILHFICQEGYLEMLQFLLEPKNHSRHDDVPLEVDSLNNKNRTPLMLLFQPPTASYLGQKFGLDGEGTPKNERPDGIETASDWIKPGGPKKREKILRLLIDAGADFDKKDYHDFTPLHYAAMWGWSTIVRLLVAKGADINGTTITGRTPLMYAVELNHPGVVKMLASNVEVEINQMDVDGLTPLLIAMELGEDGLPLIEILVDCGADINMMNNRKKTPLHIACMNQNVEQVHLLLDKKANRRPSAFNLLEGVAKDNINQRIEREDAEAQAALEALQAEQKRLEEEGMTVKHDHGYKNKSPFGQWVDYIDKRDNMVFYYNKVTRQSQKIKPKDFVKDKKRIVRETTFGHSFYHD